MSNRRIGLNTLYKVMKKIVEKATAIRGVSIFLAILFVSNVATASDKVMSKMQSLVEQQQFSAAYELGSDNPQLRGNVQFDLLFGLAAIKSDQIPEGLMALERHLSAVPANDRARLELALGYYAIGAYPRAKREFEFVLRFDPPKEVKANILRYLRLMESDSFIEESLRSGAFVEFGIGQDSNVNAGTYNDQLLLASGIVEIDDPDSNENDSQFYEIKAGGNWLKRVDKQLSVSAGLDTQIKHNPDADQFDTGNLGAFLGFSILKESGLYRFSLSDSRLWVDAEFYRNTFSLTGESTHNLGDGYNLTTVLQYSELDHTDEFESNDSSVATIGFGINKRVEMSWPLTLRANLSYGDKESDIFRDDLDSQIVTLGLSASFIASDSNVVNFGLSRQYTEYGAEDVIFGTKRDDDYWSASLGFNHQLFPTWQLRVSSSYTENESNQQLYEYRRWTTSVSVRKTF